jgi:hypothetical protein
MLVRVDPLGWRMRVAQSLNSDSPLKAPEISRSCALGRKP